MIKSVINIIVCGIGGQGVLTLSKIIRKMALSKGFKCEGATFKGGAQRMGSIYSELRIITNKSSKIISSQIPIGDVDLLIATEPWEALRYANRCHSKTQVVVNSKIETFYVDRFEKPKIKNPVDNLRKIFINHVIEDFSKQIANQSSTHSHLNILMLYKAVKIRFIPFTEKDLKNQISQL
jgi:indolepyruvate ferredoxin oxidoreductase beta subunit